MKLLMNIGDEELRSLLEGAEEEGVTLEQFVVLTLRKGLDNVKATRTVPEVLDEGIRAVQRLEKGSMFMLVDVCPNYRETLTPTDRKMLGKQFRQQLEQLELGAFVDRTQQNIARYIRK